MDFDLEEYRAQRLARERKRKDFINRFEALKAKGLALGKTQGHEDLTHEDPKKTSLDSQQKP